MRSMIGLRATACLLGGFATMGVAACSSGQDETNESSLAVKSDSGAADSGGGGSDGGTSLACADPDAGAAVVNTFIGMKTGLQIDTTSSAEFGNANLVPGADIDNSVSGAINLPLVEGATTPYLDWKDLAGSIDSHRLTDIFDGKDPSAFPGNSSCIGAANNPGKDELLYVGAANNNSFLYLNVLRASSLGDMGYTWIFTQDKPICGAQGNCDNWLSYSLKKGDVLVFGHFRTGTAKLLTAYTFNHDKYPNGLTLDATDAINWDQSPSGPMYWVADDAYTYPVAVNTDATDPGGWGTAGLKSLADVSGSPALESHVFAEGAIPTAVFVGQGGNVCGTSYWASVISKSSGNAPAGADVKDLIGPRKLSFGSLTGTASATPTCFGTVTLTASGKDAGGNAVASTCVWKEGETTISTECSPAAPLAMSAGSHTLSVTITEASGSGCSDTKTGITVNVYPAPSVIGIMTPTCTNSIDYTASGTTYGTPTYSWEFDHGIGVKSGASGTLTGLTGGALYAGTAKVVDVRLTGTGADTIVCEATDPKSATPLGPIVPKLEVSPASKTCPMSDDSVMFTASATGGQGAYSYDWTGCTSNPTIDTCMVSASALLCATQTVSVKIDDQSPLCAKTGPLTGSYGKVTTITASVP